jgi:thiamine kinase
MLPDPLQNWDNWGLPFDNKPKLIRKLKTGRTNENFVIEAENKLYVLRLNAINSVELGIDRHRELRILSSASDAGLAPELLYCSIEQGVLLTAFIDGQHWQTSLLSEPEKLASLLEGIEDIHSLDLADDIFDYLEHAENYWQQLLKKNSDISDKLHRQREKILSLVKEKIFQPGICHHDPNPLNVISQSGKLCFLDWEYAAYGWLAFDYAALSVEWNIPLQNISLPDGISTEETTHALELYLYLCELWSCIQLN